ncbi:response regulator [Ferrovibrio sp.]|uniref:response regulator n=1 Tax=Ferrovibrio sp. TaxID=1917215 RepID=UPI001B5C66FF|nr:response regulator [Ferrovibrio sp.]MBP7065111.1 response regulator [Ferrovibrio sp.]
MTLQSLNLGSLNFLVADPNPYFQSLLKGVLQAFGARHITTAETGSQALDLTRHHAYDLLFCDCYLPLLDGFDLVRQVRADNLNQNRYTPIIALTSHTQERNVARARDCGTSFVLAKPIAPKQLYDRLLWVAEDPRPYVMAESYVGPDRRFKRDERNMPRERRGIALPEAPAAAATGAEIAPAMLPVASVDPALARL